MTFSNRKAIRLKEYDYNCNGAYFITICTYGRQCIFGNVVDGAMYLSELGKIAYDEMIVTNNKRTIDGISVDKFVVMPNHIHAIIIVSAHADNKSNVGSRLAVTTNCNKFSKPIKNSLSAIIGGYKSAVTRAINKHVVDMASHVPTVWQDRFYEHIIRNEREYLEVWQYIDTNPLKWQLDSYYM